MSIENEYYTPSLEEFYIGFQFEYYSEEGNLLNKIDTTAKWNEQVVDSEWFNIIFDEYEHEFEEVANTYRVKYLTKECIESLGWVFEKLHTGTNMLTFSKFVGKYKLTLDIANYNGGIRIYEHGSGRSLNYFFGTIKNISEFKILCKQLGI